MSQRDLLEKCLNLDEELKNNIYLTLSYMNYNISFEVYNLNETAYFKKLMEYISKEENLRKLINECLLKEVNNSRDFIKQIFEKKGAVNKGDIDIISIIQKNLSKCYRKLLNVLYFKAEKADFFSSLLSSYMKYGNKISDNSDSETKTETENITETEKMMEKRNTNIKSIKKIIEETKKVFLKNLKYNDDKLNIVEKMRANTIKIILGLKLPGLKMYIELIVQKIKALKKNYKRNEKNIRNSRSPENENVNINAYNSNLKKYNDLTLKEIGNIDLFNEIIKKFDDKDLFYDLLLKDYYTIFICKNFKKDDDKNFVNLLKKVLKLLVSLRRKEENRMKIENGLKGLANTINWVESFSEEIIIILQDFYKLNKIIDNLYDKIQENTNKVNINTKNNNAILNMIESILNVVNSEVQKYIEKDQDNNKFFQLFNTITEILNQILQININLSLNSREVFSLQELMKIINFLKENDKGQVENITKVIHFFSKETLLMNEGNEKDAVEEIINLYDFLNELVGDKKDFHKLIALILENEYKKITNITQQLILLKFIFKDINLIYYSSQLIKKLISFHSTPEEMENHLKNLKKTDKYKETICEFNNEYLDEIIINYYEYEINKFFGRILNLKFEDKKKEDKNKNYFPSLYKDPTNKSLIVFDLPCKIFKECLDFLDVMIINKENNLENVKLCKLYSITYIKVYLNKFVHFICTDYKSIGNVKPIIDSFSLLSSKNLSKVIKIYILKLFFNYFNRNWNEMEQFEFQKHQIVFITEFFGNEVNDEQKEKEKKRAFLTNCFLPLDSKDDYDKIKLNFENKEMNNFEELINELPQLFKDDNLDIFLCLSINKIFSNFGFKNYLESKPKYKNYLSICNSIIESNLKKSDDKQSNLNQLLMLFFNIENYNNKIRPKIEKKNVINPEMLEMILYGFRFCAQTLNISGENENFYSLLFKKKYLEHLKKAYVPGNEYPDNPDNLKLYSLVNIEEHLNNLNDNIGCYVCSCGFYYSINPCGFPTENDKFKCPQCKQDIGYGKKAFEAGKNKHGMIIRPGHFRIFKNLNQKNEQMNKYGYSDKNIPNKTLEQYKKEVIEPILNKNKYNINRVSENRFIEKDKNIRGMSQITYRLLNFLLYNHLFYANCLGYIPDDHLKNYLHENMKCIEIMKKDWDFLKEALEAKNIASIQIFINLIFKRLTELIKKYYQLKKENEKNERDEFETQVEKLVSECIEEYPNYELKYLEYNRINLGLDKFDIRAIVYEIFEPSEEIYKFEDFPYLKYFTYTKYREREDLIKMLGPKNKYLRKHPLLYQYLQDNSTIKNLKYLPAFNEFTNFMAENYSHQISRKKAKETILGELDIWKDVNNKNKLNGFKEAWEKIYNYATIYKCNDIMKPKKLNEKDKLIYFLNDDRELGYGMYLAAACQNFIVWQNKFLQPIIDSEDQNSNLKYYAKNLKNKVPVQDVLTEFLLIDNNFEKSEFNDFKDILYTFSKRNIFNKDGKINYLTYNSYKFDFSSIEEELGKIILPGKCLFDNQDNLNFIAFYGEEIRGGKSDILSTFNLNYKQVDLTDEEIIIIIKYIKKRKIKGILDFTKIYDSLNLLMIYLINNKALNTDKISEILKGKPSYLKIKEDFIEFFEKKGKEFEINKLMNIFFYIEHLCFEDLCNNLPENLKTSIDNETQEKIKKKLSEANKENKIHSIKDLAIPLRRYISRYLVGKNQDIEIDEKKQLSNELTKLDLWEEKIWKLNNLEEIVKTQIGEFNLKIGQSFSLYEIIGEEDKEFIKKKEDLIDGVAIDPDSDSDTDETKKIKKLLKQKKKKIFYQMNLFQTNIKAKIFNYKIIEFIIPNLKYYFKLFLFDFKINK